MSEYDVEIDACGAYISCSLLDMIIQRLREKTGAKFPDDKWLIISHTRHFKQFTALFESEKPDVVVEEKEMMVKIPTEIKYAGVRWTTDDSLSVGILRVEAGKFCGLVKNLAMVGW